jgi:hypothetical protein
VNQLFMTSHSCTLDTTFPHDWRVEILTEPSKIVPTQLFVYPKKVEEVELGALHILLWPRPDTTPAMAIFALGFADTSLPHGIWSCPNPQQICAVAGGYAYIVETDRPDQWMQIPYRPVTSVHAVHERGLLLFASFHTIWALSATGQVWETARLSWEGIRITAVKDQQLHGFGWDMETDTEIPFIVDLATGNHTGGAGPNISRG